MPNMMDYIAWRGDISMAYSPFNHLDSLILAELSYLNFPLEDALLRDLDAATPEEPEHPAFIHQTRRMLSAVSKAERFAGIRMHDPVSIIDQERDMQFAAMLFDLPSGAHYVAFRGTDSTLVGWREDFNMTFESPIPAQSAAVKYLENAAALVDGPLILGGHSKGGNLSVYAAAHADEAVQRRIRTVYSFDGPGLDDATMVSDGYARIAKRIRSFVPQQSVVGLLMTYHPDYTVVRSTGTGIMQHDGFTWQMLGTDFLIVTELDVSSQVVDHTLHEWLSRISPEKRRVFISTTFDILEASGVSTVKELFSDVPAHLPAMLKALQKVDSETARMILALWRQFISIGATNILEMIRQRITPDNNEHIQGEIKHGVEG